VTTSDSSSQSNTSNEPMIPLQAPSMLSSGPTMLPVELWRSILLTQLSECWDDVRNVDSLVWQLPTGIGAILGIVLAALSPHNLSRPGLFEVAAVFGACFVTLSLLLALYKNRRFQVSRGKYIKSIYMELLGTEGLVASQMTPVKLAPVDHKIRDLPGLVALSSKDLDEVDPTDKSTPEGPSDIKGGIYQIRSMMRSRMGRVSAFKVLFRVSAAVCLGEFLLGAWLLVQLVRHG
jgi:hypothetical protein